MDKNSENKRKLGKFAVICKCLFKVINGHIFTVLNGISHTNLDYRIKSSDDNREGCVAFDNDKCWKKLLNNCYKFFKYLSPDAHASTSPSVGEVSFGRSMIEMLGVLAIIAVLSVGGIAGYFKAIEKWKSNIQRNMITELIASAIKIKPNLNSKSQSLDDITYVLNAMGDLPEGTTYQGNRIYDKDGNSMTVKYGLQVINYKDGHTDKSFIYVAQFWFTANEKNLTSSAVEYCRNLIGAAQKVADEIKLILFVEKDSEKEIGASSYALFNKSSLKTATLNEIYQKCNISLKEGGNARFTLYLEPY